MAGGIITLQQLISHRDCSGKTKPPSDILLCMKNVGLKKIAFGIRYLYDKIDNLFYQSSCVQYVRSEKMM